jgi:hypothetical protein
VKVFGCGIQLPAFGCLRATRHGGPSASFAVAVAQAGPDLDLHHRAADHLVVTLQVKHHTIDAGAEDVLDGEAPLDFRLAGS